MLKFEPMNNTNTSMKLWHEDVLADRAMSAFELPSLLGPGKQKFFSAKEIIYCESDRADTVYIIRSGLVKMLSYLPNGRARIVRLHSKGAWIGLGGLLNHPCEHTAIAIGDVEVYGIPVSRFLTLKQHDPQHFFKLIEKLYEYLCQADMWISEFSTGAIKPRVARLINFLSDIEYGESSALVDLLTVHEMADILGVTPESVSRILAEFKREDILHRLDDGLSPELYQVDTQVLHAMAGY